MQDVVYRICGIGNSVQDLWYRLEDGDDIICDIGYLIQVKGYKGRQEEFLDDLHLCSDDPDPESDSEPAYKIPAPEDSKPDTFEGESDLSATIATLEACYCAMFHNCRVGFIDCQSGREPGALSPGAPNPI